MGHFVCLYMIIAINLPLVTHILLRPSSRQYFCSLGFVSFSLRESHIGFCRVGWYSLSHLDIVALSVTLTLNLIYRAANGCHCRWYGYKAFSEHAQNMVNWTRGDVIRLFLDYPSNYV